MMKQLINKTETSDFPKKAWKKPVINKYAKTITENEGSGAGGLIAPRKRKRYSLFLPPWEF